MNINKYINWAEIWDEEVCLQTSVDCLEDNPNDVDRIFVIEQFQLDKDVELNTEECFLREDGAMVFFFSETGGQNESDTQGWSRDYSFVVNEDFLIFDAEYSQG